jgi:2-methylcitrate dehydratase PrpD
MPAPISRALAQFATTLKYEQIPALAVEAVNIGMADTVGVMLSGIKMSVSQHLRATVATRGVSKDARIWLGAETASTVDATLVNAATSSAVVFDDVAFAGCHTSTVLMPALLAEGARIGASGRDVIRGYAAGYEAWARLSEREPDSHAGKGWHATACFGPLAAAVAVCNLHGYDEATTLRAIGIAAAMSGGITASFDTDVGPFQIGRGAAGGVFAAQLAKAGMSAPEDPLERPGRGMMFALSPKNAVDVEKPLSDLGTTWRLETTGIHVKQYPFGNMNQRAIDGVLELVTKHDVKPADVEKVELLISEAQYNVISKSPSVIHFVPTHSYALAAAAAIIVRHAASEVLEAPFYERADVQAMMKKVAIATDKSVPTDRQPNMGFSGGVRLHLKSGKVLESPSVPYALGHWTRRLTEDQLWGKFAACARGQLDEAKARRLFDNLIQLHNVANVAALNTVGA